MQTLKRIVYDKLTPRQQEHYNFQKVAAALADYGYCCEWQPDSVPGVDFFARHVDGKTVLSVQLKSRLAFGRGYCGKGIFIAFRDGQQCYLYPHDELLSKVTALGIIEGTASWVSKGIYHFPTLSDEELRLLHPYRL